MVKVTLIHGNGDASGSDNWHPWLKAELDKIGIECKSPDFPNPELAKASDWLPYLDKLKVDENTLLIGHSTGAIAAMRYAESHKIFGSVLVGTYHTDLGYDSEKQSGYFDESWDWESIKKNQQLIMVFASTDDPYIPISEPRLVRDKLNAKYFEYTDQGHFGEDVSKTEFPELLSELIPILK